MADKSGEENVYLVTLKGRYKYSLQDQLYISVEDFNKRFERTIAAGCDARMSQLKTFLIERGDLQLARRAIDWSMEYVERPDLAPTYNAQCLICRVPRYRCSC